MTVEKDLENKVEDISPVDPVGRLKRLMSNRSGMTIVGMVSFLESSLPLPILTDPFLVAAILSQRSNVIRLVFVTTTASVLGGIFAYFTAATALGLLVEWMPLGYLNEFNQLASGNQSNAFILSLLGSITPIPYTIAAWVVAAIEGSVWAFIAASVIGRGARYTIVGYSVYKFGPAATTYIKRYVGISSVIMVIMVVIYFVVKV